MTHQWTPEDQAQIAARGMTVRDVEEHLDRFARGFPAIVLDRPCTVEDGIRTITHAETLGLEARFREARLSGRVSKFVPASGAASRMFHSLLVALHESWSLEDTTLAAHRDDGRDEDREFVRRFFAEAHALPFAPDLGLNAGDTPAADERLRLLRALLLEEGLGFADLPKGLIPFHRYGDEVRTAFEEHLVESLAYVRAGDGSIRLHFTVPDPQRERIASHLQACADRLGARFEISLSVQDPATDTIAVDATNEPARDANGRLLFRPGGHGALLGNLEAAGADLVFLRNIDNIEAEHPVRAPHIYRERLAGVLLAVEEEIGQLLHRLETDVADERLLREAFAFVERTLCRTVAPSIHREPLSAQVGYLIGQLSRPLRVCGMVPNAGEPGGGPFWVRHGDGSTSIQIVEKTQIQVQDPTQRALLEAATHFNPVDLVCSLKGRDGRPYRLAGFVDAESGLITEKTAAGRVLRALEWPGLWNGAMARWNTVFVELPLETFNPVKTVLDLLRPAHRG